VDRGVGPLVVKRVLMIAFHFPPLRGSSGIQRTLKFAQYLPALGWTPLVLSAHRRAYAEVGDDLLADIAPGAVVRRAFALDSARHLSIKGRYSQWLALPDRWIGWLLGAVPAGLKLVRQYRPAVIWSTYPIATAHLIGLVLQRLTGIPWVADMRDPMSDNYYPLDPFLHKVYRSIETRVINRCSKVVCTTPGAIEAYRARFPHLPATHFVLIENGYDEASFVEASALPASAPAPQDRFTLDHSGLIYPLERDPIPLFDALAALKAQGAIDADNFQLVLRGSGHDAYLRALIDERGIASLVTLAPQLGYRDALRAMMGSHALLLLQAANCNHQIPAKLYEYLRAGRPVLALTDPAGDTACALLTAGIDTMAPLDDKHAIMARLLDFMQAVRAGTAPLASSTAVTASSRRARTAQLALLLDEVANASA
jgi:glycosyltransferase involved in cell wall biosynthesis